MSIKLNIGKGSNKLPYLLFCRVQYSLLRRGLMRNHGHSISVHVNQQSK